MLMSSVPREDRPSSTRQPKIDRPAPFETISTSGPTVEAAIRALREAVAQADEETLEGTAYGSGVDNESTTRTAMALLFYTHCDKADAPADGHRLDGTGSGIREELSQLHGWLPGVDHIIGECSRAILPKICISMFVS